MNIHTVLNGTVSNDVNCGFGLQSVEWSTCSVSEQKTALTMVNKQRSPSARQKEVSQGI